MKKNLQSGSRRAQQGIALLIAIFVLLLISVVAIALLVSSGTETALGANYRSSSTVYYAALAGLEEARGRMLSKNPNYFGPAIVPPGTSLATALPLGQAVYVVNANALITETVAPWDSGNLYFDTEYQSEFGIPASSASWQSVNSVWNNHSTPGPMYKWVRINAVTEQSLYIDVNQDGVYDSSTLLFYDPAHLNSSGNPMPSLIVSSSPPSTAVQALEITALAYLPNGSKKILQYLVAPATINLVLPAALTLDGHSDAFSSPDHSYFRISGNSDGGDSACSSMSYPVPAIGVPDQTPDVNYVISGNPGPGSTGIPVSPNETGNFTGNGPTPNVVQVTLPSNLQTVQSLNQIVQTILQNADAVIAGPATEANLPSAMSYSNPMTVAIQGDPTQVHQGDFHLGTTLSGFGLLLVTGNFTYDTGSNWNGIVLVVGQGIVNANENGGGGTFSGGMLIAQTRDTSGNLLTNLGPASFTNVATPNVGSGIYYNCSWIQAAQAPLTYKILSFHEIPQ
ncbi:MAG: hypothetical protein ABSH39_04700 [Candidatus Acidiferrum sp.]|jgi:hypothetical protein